MKKAKRSMIALCIICILSIIGTVTVYAKDTSPKNIELTGGAKGLLHIPNDKLFLSNLKMIPGSSASGIITIKNTEDIPYKLTLEAEQITNGEYLGENFIDLLDHINLEITYNGETVFKGPISKQDDDAKVIDLGIYKPDSSGKLEAKVVLDQNIGNEYKNKYGEVKWIFTATEDEKDTQSENIKNSNNIYSSIPSKISRIYKTSDPLLIAFMSIFVVSFAIIMIKFYKFYMKGRGGIDDEKV